MNFIENLPNKKITESGDISCNFIREGVKDFHEACLWTKNLPYGYNSNKYDPLIIFKEKRGTCSSKHGTIAALAKELDLPVSKFIGFYKLDNSIITGIDEILDKYNLNYIPQTHCFLGSNSIFVDLTQGNCHFKNKDLTEFDLTIKVNLMPGRDEEDALYRFGLDYYYGVSPDLRRFDKEEIINILNECDSKHLNLCSLKQSTA